MFEDGDPPLRPQSPAGGAKGAVIGEDLSRLSVADLESRIDALRAEISRIEAEITARGGVRAAADALFRK